MRTRLFFSALGVTLSACMTDVAPIAPPPPIELTRTPAASLASRFKPNKTKYRNAGIQAKKVKDGSVEIEVRGVFGADASTVLEVTIGSFDDPLTGLIKRVTVAPVDGSADAITFANLDNAGYFSATLTPVVPGTVLDVHVQVIPQASRKAVNLKGEITIAKRPDLTVASVSVPARGILNVPVLITAELRELNHDVGARADCVLSVDGIVVDQATGIWVDAGDVVNCLFTRTFAAGGAHSVTVVAANVSPGDWDATNNFASASIMIDQPIASGSLNVRQDNYTETYLEGWDGFTPQQHTKNWYYGNSDIDLFSTEATVHRHVQRAEVTITRDGAPVHTATLLPLGVRSYEESDGSYGYVCKYFDEGNQLAETCVGHYYGVPYSQLHYRYTTGMVSYYGQDVACILIFCTTTYFSESRPSGTGFTLGFAQGSVVGVSVAFEDEAGSRHFTDRSVVLDAQFQTYDTGNQCRFRLDLAANYCQRTYYGGVIHRGSVHW